MKFRTLTLAVACAGMVVLGNLLNPAGATSKGGTQVEIYDHGLNLPIYSLTLPPGWQMRHFIATDLNDVWRMYAFYAVDFFGSDGQFVTHFTPTVVYSTTGQHWESVWLDLFNERVGRLGQFQIGTTQRNTSVSMFPNAARFGIPVFERSIHGVIGDQQLEGRLFTLMADLGYAGILYPHAVIVPKGLWLQTVETLQTIAASQTENPQYPARSRQIMQQRMQQANSIMQANRDWFNSFQSTMRQMSQLRSQNNRDFANYLKAGHSAYGSSDYSTSDMFGDYLRDTTTFKDPYSSFQVAQPGQYAYWYTDSLGHYYGTDDPNFDPNALIGDWSGISPLQP